MSEVASNSKYKPYLAYKDSGIEWLGQVPEHWLKATISRLFDLNAGGDLKTQFFSEEKSDSYPYPIYTNTTKTSLPYGYTSKSVFKANTITVTGRGDVGFAVYRDHPYDAIIRLLVLEPKNEKTVCPYFTYFINAVLEFNEGSSAIGQLSTTQIAPYPLLIPAYEEQTQIANFLDQETSKIDTLIAKQQTLIELLKEKRQAVISYAVTKGLNPTAKMKDSGIQWLGDIPEHWEVMQVRYATEIFRGKFTHRPRNDPKLYDGEYPFIQTGDVARANKFIESYKQTLNENGIRVSQKFPKGSLVMAIAANIGDVAILDFDSYAPDSVVSFKPRNNMNLFYLRYFFIGLLDILKSTAIQSTQANLNIERVGELKNGIPPITEQLSIVDYLDTQTQKIDTLIDKSQQAIELLKERKTALISAAVTGKIDVRGVA